MGDGDTGRDPAGLAFWLTADISLYCGNATCNFGSTISALFRLSTWRNRQQHHKFAEDRLISSVLLSHGLFRGNKNRVWGA